MFEELDFLSRFAIYLAVFWLVIRFGRRRIQKADNAYPPGPFKWPLIGNLLQIDHDNPHRSFVKWAKQYGPVYTVWLPRPTVVLASYELLKEVNNLYGNEIAGRPQSYLYGIFTGHKKDGDGIILCQGEKWDAQRKFALKTFHNFGMGKQIMESKINYHKNLLLKRLFGLCDTDAKTAVVDPEEHLSFCVGNIINDMVIGRYYHFGEPEFLKFKELIDNTLEGFASVSMQLVDMYPCLRHVLPYYQKYCQDGFEIQHYFLREIEEHDKNFDENAEPTNFIDAYLSEIKKGNKLLDKKALALNAGDLWTGGMETTVTTIQWGIIYMIHHPEIQEKLQREIDSVLDTEPPSMNRQRDLPYVRATIDELQRIVNVLPWGIPHQTLANVKIGKYMIPENTVLMPQVGAVHLDDRNFPNPEKFDPGRFLDENGCYCKNPLLNPFGLGKRSCLGESLAKMELFLIFTSLIQNFTFLPYQDILPCLERSAGMSSVPMPFLCEIRHRKKFDSSEIYD
uniref:Cytochrome P450 n=1 Tax=Panagrolaimus sp. JU765 TaxID=591449 RepID=A0AC34PW10_9BILA